LVVVDLTVLRLVVLLVEVPPSHEDLDVLVALKWGLANEVDDLEGSMLL
jgi:hypothetical protein